MSIFFANIAKILKLQSSFSILISKFPGEFAFNFVRKIFDLKSEKSILSTLILLPVDDSTIGKTIFFMPYVLVIMKYPTIIRIINKDIIVNAIFFILIIKFFK